MSASRGTQRTDPATVRLTGWIAPVVEAAGYDLEELVVTPAGRRSVVRVVVDRDEGVTLDDIADVSRAVSVVLDQNDEGMGRTPYVLEVSSPGVDRPLTERRHWRRNTGRLVSVAVGPTDSADEVTGRVTAVDDDGVTLAVEAKAKPGARKRAPTPRRVPWSELGSGRVQVEFGRPDAAGDPDGSSSGVLDGHSPHDESSPDGGPPGHGAVPTARGGGQ